MFYYFIFIIVFTSVSGYLGFILLRCICVCMCMFFCYICWSFILFFLLFGRVCWIRDIQMYQHQLALYISDDRPKHKNVRIAHQPNGYTSVNIIETKHFTKPWGRHSYALWFVSMFPVWGHSFAIYCCNTVCLNCTMLFLLLFFFSPSFTVLLKYLSESHFDFVHSSSAALLWDPDVESKILVY